MTLKKNLWPSLALGLFLSFFLHAPAISQVGYPISSDVHAVPYVESGNWWDTARPGEGVVLERQGTLVGIIIFSFTASGEPEFYLGTGPIHISALGGDPPVLGGVQRFLVDGTLFRFRNGPVFNSDRSYFEGDPPANEAEPVGRIHASIVPFSRILRVQITLDEDKVPEGSERVSTRYYRKSTFGYGGLGRMDNPSGTYQASRACWVDLRGRWVFVNNSNPAARDVWSFNFTELETSPAPGEMTCLDHGASAILADHRLLYRDTETGATLRCVTKGVVPWADSSYQPEHQRCVLRTGDSEPLLWFSVLDVGAKQIIGTPGAPPNNPMFWRGFLHERITGLRVD